MGFEVCHHGDFHRGRLTELSANACVQQAWCGATKCWMAPRENGKPCVDPGTKHSSLYAVWRQICLSSPKPASTLLYFCSAWEVNTLLCFCTSWLNLHGQCPDVCSDGESLGEALVLRCFHRMIQEKKLSTETARLWEPQAGCNSVLFT